MKYKICLVGAFAVGKTSLVRQFVHSIFSEKYHTTIGVKIDKKTIVFDDQSVELMIWDIEGVDVFTELKPGYLRGASGIIFVADGTRPKTFDTVRQLVELADKNLEQYSKIVLVNKFDLQNQWTVTPAEIVALGFDKDATFCTSARTGQAVDEAFRHLASRIISHSQAKQ